MQLFCLFCEINVLHHTVCNRWIGDKAYVPPFGSQVDVVLFRRCPAAASAATYYCLPLTLNWLARSLLSVLEQLVAFCKRHWLQPWTKIFIMNNNNNNNSTRFSSVNNNNNNNNNSTTGSSSKCNSFCDSCNTGNGKPSLSQQQPPPIQVTAKVLFGSVTAISALNAERKKKT